MQPLADTVLMLAVIGGGISVALQQMLGSLTFDHFSLFGIPQHSINPSRMLGALLLVAGVLLVRFA